MSDMEIKKNKDIAVLISPPLDGCVPNDVRTWLREQHETDAAIAEAMSKVGMKAGWLMHELDDPDNDEKALQKYHEEFDMWYELEKELVKEIVRRLGIEKVEKGWHYIIEPFMNKNGYRDGAGWWIKEE